MYHLTYVLTSDSLRETLTEVFTLLAQGSRRVPLEQVAESKQAHQIWFRSAYLPGLHSQVTFRLPVQAAHRWREEAFYPGQYTCYARKTDHCGRREVLKEEPAH